jgi:hypothetical protein
LSWMRLSLSNYTRPRERSPQDHYPTVEDAAVTQATQCVGGGPREVGA